MAKIDAVELLRRQYLQALDPGVLVYPDAVTLKKIETQQQVYACMFDVSKIKFLPPERYQFRVLKRLTLALESALVDPDEDVGHAHHADGG